MRVFDGRIAKGTEVLLHLDRRANTAFSRSATCVRSALSRARSLRPATSDTSPLPSKRFRHPGGRHGHDRSQPLRRGSARLSPGARNGLLRHIHRRTAASTPICATRWKKLQLNDASLSFEPESSAALGFGFRCGFWACCTWRSFRRRLEREFDLDLVTTLPSVIYKVVKTDGGIVMVDNPHNTPTPALLSTPRSRMSRCRS